MTRLLVVSGVVSFALVGVFLWLLFGVLRGTG
jgi:hypothetical protein